MSSQIKTAQKEAAMAEKILMGATQTFELVDNSFIIRERGHAPRAMPFFRPEEISLGKVLGTGGFGIVNEITKFTLDEATSDNNLQVEEIFTNNHVHYDVLKARAMMEKRCCRGNNCRYALKRLRGDLSVLEKARGKLDLAVEAKYLSVVWHPNIIKMRGLAGGDLLQNDFFIILDRLECTLDQKINEWYRLYKNQGQGLLSKLRFGENKRVAKELLIDRLTVAYDLAAAFFYLHENRLVYRDIKPENIGFDVRGDVKVFDFGLCKSLSTHLKAREGYGYRLTGRAGSLPYMAPEVIKMETYDTKCDVYSFAILLWELLSLRQAYKGLSPTEFVERIVVKHERLRVPSKTPPLTRLMLPEAWDHDPRKRPDMKRVAILIRGDLNDMTTDSSVLHRTKHMDDRSEASLDHTGYGHTVDKTSSSTP